MFLGNSFDDDATVFPYASPYRSLLSASSLAASVKVNSVVRPALIPALSAHINVSILEVKFSNHLHAIGQGNNLSLLVFRFYTEESIWLLPFHGRRCWIGFKSFQWRLRTSSGCY